HRLLPDLTDVLRDRNGAHAAPHSLRESPNAPACSRTAWNCPVFSANFTLVCGTDASSSAASSIGWSSSAGSQKEAARKITPSALQDFTVSSSAAPFFASPM